MPLQGMLAEVTQAKVKGLLEKRSPDLVEDPETVARFEALVSSAAVEVVLLAGVNPPGVRVRGLAVEAIAYQTASEIEYAVYPDQQVTGDLGRGAYLHRRYLELLARLEKIIEGNGGRVPGDDGPVVAPTGKPRGRFPAPMEYPDPSGVRGRRF